jgi:eukaryotic-like serine/threonine-protein kinase
VQPPEIQALLDAGKHAEAAAALRAAGDLERAQDLYEKIWDFARAAEVARERGDRPALLRLLLDAKQIAEARQIGQALLSAAPGEQTRAAEVYERRRLFAEAAVLRESLGQLDAAHTLYKKAQQPLEAARVDETLGRTRDAGIVYERFLADEPNSPDAPRAHLALGRILLGFQRHEEAVRHLQRASRGSDADLAERARRLLVVSLLALGYRDGASAVLDELRAKDAALPLLDDFVAAERRALEGGASLRLGGRYSVERLLGSGGMGRVYLARDELTGGKVAVKVVAPPTDSRLQQGYQRFVREARVVSSLNHANLVGVTAFHEDLGLLAMEYMAGGTLADRLPGPLPPKVVRALVMELCAGLEAAHAHGVIHRDIKPANVFFSASGEAKLGDFGVAHLQDLGATQTAGFIGTLAYMSPEQISGAPLTFACDVYALGVTAFQALTGRLPFRGPDFVGQHLGETPPSPSHLNPAIDAAWDTVVLSALAKDPRARFASLEQMRHAVARVGVDVPGAQSAAGPSEESAPIAVATERYVIGGPLGATAFSELYHASDSRLGREVVVERFKPGFLDGEGGALHLQWLRAIARHGGPRLQRILRIERLSDGAHQVVYEAVTGTPAAALDEPALKLLATALAPLHAEGVSHGSLSSSTVLEAHGPIVLVAGRAPQPIKPEDERRALHLR